MPTRRMIDPAIWQSETIAALTRNRRLLFIGLFSNADDQGRLRAHPALIRSLVFPYDDIPLDEIEADLQAIAEQGSIHLYEAGGKRCLQIVNWWKYQSPQWAYPSKISPPDGWADRLRYRKDNQVLTQNWKDPLPNGLPMAIGRGLDCGHRVRVRDSISDSSSDQGADAPAPNGAPPPKSKQGDEQEMQKPPKMADIPMTEGLRHFLDAFGRKRFATMIQKRALAECEREVGTGDFVAAIDWAARNNIRNVDSIIKAAKNWGKGKKRGNNHSGRSRQTDGSATLSPESAALSKALIGLTTGGGGGPGPPLPALSAADGSGGPDPPGTVARGGRDPPSTL